MIVYKLVITTGDKRDEIMYLHKVEAERHRDHVLLSPWHRPDTGDDAEIKPIEATSIAHQSIFITGDSVGYMFADRWGQGHRTIRRTVRNLSLGSATEFTGTIRWNGRLIKVIKLGPGLTWKAQHVVGYV